MKKKLFALQTAGTAATLAAAYLVLLVPDSTAGYLLLSLLLMYATVFLLSFTLAAVAGALVTQAFLPAAQQGTHAGRDLLRLGWRGWGRAAAVLLAAAGLLYAIHRLGWLRLPVWVLISLLALLAIPAAVRGAAPAAAGPDRVGARLARTLAYAAVAVALGFAAWKIITAPAEMSRPWLEVGYLGARVVTSFLVANLACVLLLAAGAVGLTTDRSAGAN